MKLPEKARKYALIGCCALFIVSGFMLIRDVVRSTQEENANKDIAETIHEVERVHPKPVQRTATTFDTDTTTAPAEQTPAEPVPEEPVNTRLLEKYQSLWQKNNDFSGWLRIEGTNVDYPVMYTPNDPEYYLRRGFNKKYAGSGSLFVGPGSSPDGNHAIIYGHHMRNGSMFGSLPSYAKASYAKQHPVICYDTLTEIRDYEVLGAFYSKVYNNTDTGVFKYYQYADLSDPQVFDEYIRHVKAESLYDTGLDVQYGDSILTLSTCSYHTKNGRFVVMARKINAAV